MEQKDIIEGNQIIMRFMGHGGIMPEYNQYWEDLMPVVEKIGQTYNVRIHVNLCSITRRFMDAKKYAKDNGIGLDEVPPIAESDKSDFIGNVYLACVDFIKFYNTNNPHL